MAAIRASVCIKRVNFDSVYCRAKEDGNQVNQMRDTHRIAKTAPALTSPLKSWKRRMTTDINLTNMAELTLSVSSKRDNFEYYLSISIIYM